MGGRDDAVAISSQLGLVQIFAASMERGNLVRPCEGSGNHAIGLFQIFSCSALRALWEDGTSALHTGDRRQHRDVALHT